MRCFVCSNTDFDQYMQVMGTEFTLQRCTNCDVVVAVSNKKEIFDYTEYGDYLVDIDVYMAMKNCNKKYYRLVDDVLERFGDNPLLVDIGAGAGFFVRYCHDNNITAYGVEPSLKLRGFAAQKLGVSLYADISCINDNSVDVVTCFDVIEHVEPSQQRSFMKEINRVLKKGGVLIGNTPNIASLNIKMAKDKDPVIWPPSHMVYYSMHTLDFYLDNCNMRKIYCYSKGFVPFRSQKNTCSFIDRPKTLLQECCAWPLKALLTIIGYALRYTRMGYQIHFCYSKP